MPFNLFHKKKQPEPETPAVPPQEEPPQEAVSTQPPEQPAPEPAVPVETPVQESVASTVSDEPQPPEPEPPVIAPPPVEQKPETPVSAEPANKTYLKAMPLKELSDIEKVKTEVKNGNIIILRVTPLASKSIEDVKSAVNELFQFAESTGGDIARLGEERVVVCPKSIRIWREKTPAPVSNSQPLPTAA